MKLLVLSHVSDFIGGAEKSLMNIIDAWLAETEDLEIEFVIRSPLGGLEKELDCRKIKYHSVDYTYWSDSNLPDTPDRIYGNSVRNMRAVNAIVEIIRDFKPDVVLTNSIIAPWAAIAAHFEGVPHVWMVREYGNKDHGREFEIGERETFEDIGNLSELVFSNSLTLAQFVGSYTDKNKIRTIYTPFNLVKLEKQSLAEVANPYHGNSQLKIMLTGNIARGKGHELVIQAIGELKKLDIDAEVAFIGRPADEVFAEELRELADSHDISKNVHYLGYKENPLAYSKYADVAVMTSRMEAFGRVTFEYIASGLPVVGSNSGATPEIVLDDENGFLYKPGSATDLAEKLKRYINEPKLIAEHSRAAKDHAKTMMASEHNAENALAHLRSVIGAPKTTFTKLNYSRRWTQYPLDAKAYMEYVSTASVPSIVKFRLKNMLRPHYVRLNQVSSRVRSANKKGGAK